MRTHVALLRGINVGGHNKVAMADLRRIVSSLGLGDVETYIQSGNVVFTSEARETSVLADDLERAIAQHLGVQCGVVVLSREDLTQAIAHNPFPQETNHRNLHAVFRRVPMSPDELSAVDVALLRAREKKSQDEVAVVGTTMFLRTPEGMGRSELAAQLSRSKGGRAGTARNWATVTKLMELLDA